jgi:peroxiredoxin
VPRLAVGEQASLFSLPDATGQMVELAARLEQGPVVLSFYWHAGRRHAPR